MPCTSGRLRGAGGPTRCEGQAKFSLDIVPMYACYVVLTAYYRTYCPAAVSIDAGRLLVRWHVGPDPVKLTKYTSETHLNEKSSGTKIGMFLLLLV